MSGIEAGIPLVHAPSEDSDEPWQARVPMGTQPTHRAYPVEYAVARDSVVHWSRELMVATVDDAPTVRCLLLAALDALADAGSES